MKLGGFGVAIQLPSKEEQSQQNVNGGRIGTPHFMAPEVIQRKAYGKPVDIWSTGVVLHILLSGSMPFLGTKDRLYESVCAGKLHISRPIGAWSKISDSAKELLRAMLTTNPDDRITVEEALDHRWIRERDIYAPKLHLQETVDELRKFNSRRKLKGAVLAAVSSPKWGLTANDLLKHQNGGRAGTITPKRGQNILDGAGAGVVTSSLDFGVDDEATSSAVGLVLDSLDDIHCLLEARSRETSDQPEFLYPVLVDEGLHALLNLYDQISTTSYRPFRYPPSDATLILNEALASIDAFFDQEDLADIVELRDTLNQCHVRALIQSHDVVAHEVYGEDAIRVTPPPFQTTFMGGIAHTLPHPSKPQGVCNRDQNIIYPPQPSRMLAESYPNLYSATNNGSGGRNGNYLHDATPVGSENVTRVRLVQFQRNTEEPMGITLKLSDEGKCIVGRIMHGGMIHRQATLHVGDEIREINGMSVANQSIEALQRLLREARGSVTFKIVPSYRSAPPPCDIFVRAQFDYDPMEDDRIPCPQAGIPFITGDVLQIISKDDHNYWQARKVAASGSAGLIPSPELQVS